MSFKREVITHTTDAAWLADRKKYVTSTEAAGLFDAGSYENADTFYALYHVKAGLIEAKPMVDNDLLRWGRRLEMPIALGMAEDYGLIVEPMKVFMVMPEFRIASSFDYKIVGIVDGFEGDETYRNLFRQHGPGIMECKSVRGQQFRRAWIDDGETLEATPQIEFQVAHQLEIADMPWAMIAPLIDGNTPKPLYRLRDHAVGQAIRDKAAELWQRVNAMAPPEPDFTKDGGTIAKVYRDNDGTSVDMYDNTRLAALCKAYKKAGADEKAAKELKDAAKAEILTIVQAAKSVAYDGGKISAGTNKASFRCYYRDAYEKLTVTLTPIAGADIEATVPPFRNVRVA